MKRFLRDHGLWVLFAAAVIAVALAVMSYFSNTSSPLTNVAGLIASPFRSAYTAVAGWFNEKQAYFADIQALQEETRPCASATPSWRPPPARASGPARKMSSCASG